MCEAEKARGHPGRDGGLQRRREDHGGPAAVVGRGGAAVPPAHGPGRRRPGRQGRRLQRGGQRRR
jgi:hypothetical protein